MNVFDLDGTIIDITERWYRLHVDMTREEQLTQLQREAYISLKRDGVSELEIMNNRGTPQSIEAYIAKREQYIEHPRYLAYDGLVPDIRMVLEVWGARSDLLLATNRRDGDLCMAQLERFSIAQHFVDFVFAGAEGKAAAISRQVPLQRLERRYFVSDALEDRDAAAQLGMRALTVAYGCRSEAYFHRNGIEQVLSSARALVPFV